MGRRLKFTVGKGGGKKKIMAPGMTKDTTLAEEASLEQVRFVAFDGMEICT